MSTPGPPLGDPSPVNPPSPHAYLNHPGWDQQPGWQQHPGWGQPGWDHPAWQYPQMPYPPLPPKRANGKAFAIAAAVGAVVWLAVGIFLAAWSDENAAFVTGQSFGIALIPAVVVAIIAFLSGSHWPLWRYPLFIAPAALVLTVLTAVVGTTILSDSGRTHQRRTAAAPAVVGTWTRDDSPAAKAQLQQAKDQYMQRLGSDVDTADLALYESGDERAVLVVVTTRPGSGVDNETRLSPRQAAVDELGGAGVDQPTMVDAGPLGGALGCGASTTNKQLYMCTWAELGMVGTVMFANTTTAPDSAAQITRDFRSSTEH